MKGQPPQEVLDKRLALADAQLVIAREYGFRNWAELKRRVELTRQIEHISPHPGFAAALAALDAGDVDRLPSLIAADPSLVRARTNLGPPYGYFGGATLLHHVAGNPGRDKPLPPNIVDIARVLLDAGADVNARTLGPNGGDTIGLLVTGKQASDMGVTGSLMDLLVEHGADLDLTRDDALDASLANHSPAHCAIDLHDAVCFDLREHIEARLQEDPASINKRLDQWEFLQCAPLHWAACVQIEDVDGIHPLASSKRAELVELLLEKGADPNIVAGNGITALDVAHTGRARRIAELLERRGGRRAVDL